MFTKKFLLSLLERALKTFAQAAGAMLIAAGTGLLDTDWLGVLSVSAMAAIASVLLNISVGAVTDGTPSIGNIETITPATGIPVGPGIPIDPASYDGTPERGRQLASEREDLIAEGVDPDDLDIPLAPPDVPGPEPPRG